MVSKRTIKVADLIRREISQIIIDSIEDPLVGFVTVTSVKLSDDLKNAKIYVTTLGNEKQQTNTLKGLKRATPFIRSQLGFRTHLRYIPQINFVLDDTFNYAQNIERLLRTLKK